MMYWTILPRDIMQDFFRKTKSFIFLGMHHLLEELRKKGECPVDRETVIFIRQPMPGQVSREHDPSAEF